MLRDAQRTEQLEHREQLAVVRQLPERQQRLLWLCAAGWRYTEIAAISGDSARTVERQLGLGRARLRTEMAA